MCFWFGKGTNFRKRRDVSNADFGCRFWALNIGIDLHLGGILDPVAESIIVLPDLLHSTLFYLSPKKHLDQDARSSSSSHLIPSTISLQ